MPLLEPEMEELKRIQGDYLPNSNMLWISVNDLLLDIRASFQDSGAISEEAIIRKYTDVHYLTLDDVGPEKITDWVLQTLYTIIDRRCRDIKPTLITSNLKLSEIEAKMGARIASRISKRL